MAVLLNMSLKGLKSDRKIIFAATKKDGRAFKYAPEELRRDREIVLAVVNKRAGLLNMLLKN